MPQRHSKNKNDIASFTYDENRKLGNGTQRERLDKDSIKPFDACCLCLKPLIDSPCGARKAMSSAKNAFLSALLCQKKHIQRKLAVRAVQQKQDKEEEGKLMIQKDRELDVFDQQNHGAVPQYSDKNNNKDTNGFRRANSVKATFYEEEALRTMKAFWLPSATPEEPAKVEAEAPSTSKLCPEGQENLNMKTMFPIHFTEDSFDDRKSISLQKAYICPSCKVTLTNASSLCRFLSQTPAHFVVRHATLSYATPYCAERLLCEMIFSFNYCYGCSNFSLRVPI